MEKIKIGQVFKLRNCEKKRQYQFGKVTSLKPLKLYFTGGATRRGHLFFGDTLVLVKLNGEFYSAPIS